MYGAYSTAVVPVRIRSVARFTGPNPWSGAAAAEWSIEAYRMVQERYAATVAQNPSGRVVNWVSARTEAFGIRSDSDGRYHMMPVVLSQLWQSKQVDATQLPRLLHAIEPELRHADYAPFFGAKASLTAQKWLCGILGALGLALLWVYLFLVPPASRSYRNITTQEWLSQPVNRVQSWDVSDPVQIEGAYKTASPAHLPEGMQEVGYDTGSIVGWYQAADGHRLALVGNDFKSDIPRLRLFGTVLKTSAIGLPPALLQQIASQAPDVKTDYIFCTHWDWIDHYSEMSEAGPVFLWGGAAFVVLASLFYWWANWRRKRFQERSAAIESRLKGMHV